MKTVPVFTREKASGRGTRFRQRVVQERRGLVVSGRTLFRRALETQFSEMRRRAVEGQSSVPAALQSAQEVPVPSDAMREALERFFVDAAVRFGPIGLEHLKGMARIPTLTKQEDTFRRRAQEYLDQIGAEKVTQISETTRRDLVTLLQQAIEDGEGIDRAARRISNEIPNITQSRATVISRTEIIPASNQAVDIGAREAGIPLDKEWITAIDGREREAHRAADGSIVDMDEPFTVMGERLRFPGDTSLGATAPNVIQCRCAHAPIPKDR